MLLDGAMGSLLSGKGLSDLLNLCEPETIRKIHRAYLEAGADIITTNTFSSQRVSLAGESLPEEYMTEGMAAFVEQLNRSGVRLAREEADRMTALTPEQPRFVIGDVGPTTKLLSMSEQVDDPAARALTFDEMEQAYYEQMCVLAEEGVDAILLETIVDTLSAKAGIHAFMRAKETRLSGPKTLSNSPLKGENKKSPFKGDLEGLRIAVVGSGPAGLAFAGDMAKFGYRVTVFEALHEIGGVLKYGIPEFRLPNRIVDAEIDGLRALGVEFKTDTIVGKTITVEQLQAEGYAGIFVGSGAGLPRFMNIPGENLNGVLSCNEYLTRVNLMDASSEATDTPLLRGRNVVVVGGGNTAMDAVRTAKRLGAEHAIIVYRRSEEEMPARIEEVHHAKAEGIEFMTLHNPLEYHADENGRVKEAVLQVMTLGEPDESGRRSPVPVEGETVTIAADLVIVSVGVSPNPLIPSTVKGLEISKKGTIVVNEKMQSALPTLFAGGDIVRGGATVILAMADGRHAAKEMHAMLSI